jgi:UDP-3-O-[3-hydroxymyristoyl] glucosamine N-acyltransferase
MRFSTLAHPMARISRSASVGEGSILSVSAIIAAQTRLGRHVIVNRAALVGHNTAIGDFVTIGPGANIAGCCSIGEATYIGMGAIITDHLNIGSHSVTAGALRSRYGCLFAHEDANRSDRKLVFPGTGISEAV